MKVSLTVCALIPLFFLSYVAAGLYEYVCTDDYCTKTLTTPETEDTAVSLEACQLFCSESGAIWPKPTGDVVIATTLVNVDINDISAVNLDPEKSSYALLSAAFDRFKQQVTSLAPNQANASDRRTIAVSFVIENTEIIDLSLDTDESYKLSVTQAGDGAITVAVTSNNFFGSRHALETLSQLIIYDDIRDEVKISSRIEVSDGPKYAYRGILLDTARNYISLDTIRGTLDGMAASKLNRFHWHITDSHSFPFTSESFPNLTKYGAYTAQKVYTVDDVAAIVTYGLERGVRVIPEFDAPAHVGEGWAQTTDFVTCFNAKPWQSYCVEPPCGQFDPSKDQLYDALETVYGEMLTQFKNPDIFHMGGDEVHFGCWNSTPGLVEWMAQKNWGTTKEDFVQVWDYFQSEALARLYKQAGKEIPVILWTNTLTEKDHLHYLNSSQYIIQIWSTADDPVINDLLTGGYNVIISNYDALYLDCGFGGWVTAGNNWCSPYKGWQTVYDNTPTKIAGSRKNQVLGSEAALWTESVDSATVDNRLWPRAAALGEVLWSETDREWRTAETRFLIQRERLVRLGLKAEAIEPEWCRQYQESCPLDGKDNGDFEVAAPPTTEPPPPPNNSTQIAQFSVLLLIFSIVTAMIDSSN